MICIKEIHMEENLNFDERADLAYDLKSTGQGNCTQVVLKAFEDKMPLSPDDYMKLSAGFAVGMGCMESTCGALIGAVMVAGILSEGKGTAKIAKSMLLNFKEKCGDTICKKLKGIGEDKVLCECPDCCKNAVLSLKESMG